VPRVALRPALYEGAFPSFVYGAAKIVQDEKPIMQYDVLATGIRQITGDNTTR